MTSATTVYPRSKPQAFQPESSFNFAIAIHIKDEVDFFSDDYSLFLAKVS